MEKRNKLCYDCIPRKPMKIGKTTDYKINKIKIFSSYASSQPL